MKKITSSVKKNWIFLSPLFIGLYPAVFLYSENISIYTEQALTLPLILSLMLISLVLVACRLVFKKIEVAVPLSSIIIFLLLSFNKLYVPLQDAHLGIISSKVFYTIVVLAVVLVSSFLILKAQKKIILINKLFTLISFILLVFALLPIIRFELKEGRVFRASPGALRIKSNQKVKPPENAPDIYYIMPEDYSGPKALKEQYGFDDSPFLNALNKRGFYIAQDSTTNYPKTFLSLASSMNMEYVDFLTQHTKGGASSDESIATPLIENNKVIKFLKDNGYTYIHMGSWWEQTKTNPNADKNFIPKKDSYWGMDEFSIGFIADTAFTPLLNLLRNDSLNVSEDPRNNDHRMRMFYQFETGSNVIPEIPGPKFVFIHIMAPHEPFVVDKNCKPVSEDQIKNKSLKDNSLEQIQCVNKQMLKMVDGILSKSKKPPVILLQTDEGGFPINAPLEDDISWASADDQALDEKFPILNAYYFPDKDYSSLYQGITPVNSFRIVLNKYFNQDMELLPDKNYIFQDKHNLYKFTDVTEKVKK